MRIDPLTFIRMLAGAIMVWIVVMVVAAFILMFQGMADVMNSGVFNG
jgi:hypothetical protein